MKAINTEIDKFLYRYGFDYKMRTLLKSNGNIKEYTRTLRMILLEIGLRNLTFTRGLDKKTL